jgi:UDP-N-acetylmuramoyl-L-alanyl-D-glutamate--2,6-diaminopimelate ligase
VVESLTVRLTDLFAGVDGWRLTGADVDIGALSYRSDQAGPGTLFFCVPGFVRDGHDFAPDAAGRGAAALCVERLLDIPVPQVVVPSVRWAMGSVASAFYGHPSSRMLTAGITGTNGKTTSAFLVAHLLDHAGLRAGLLGTVERRIGGETLPAGRTTPEALDVQRDFAQMVAGGDKAAVMEVSSHALDLGRARGIDFRTVAFTNLTQDHLDYHKTLEEYFAAKCRLFLDGEFAAGAAAAAINVGDPFGLRLAKACDRQRVIGFSVGGGVADWGPADLEMSDFSMTPSGTRGTLVVQGTALARAGGRGAGTGAGTGAASGPVAAGAGTAPDISREVFTRLVGAFNVENTLTALGCGLGLGLDLEQMLAGLSDFGGVPGRMETVDAGQDFSVIVDYAHTPDSVSNVLRTARDFTQGRLFAVIGCGGDRDRTKRPLMGREAEEHADMVVVTSDNPRSEDPAAIIAEILQGLRRPEKATVQVDRRIAIQDVVAQARTGDVVMILGKGHESGQEFSTGTIPFDDRQVAREALLARGSKT